jgi:hypothetical protein
MSCVASSGTGTNIIIILYYPILARDPKRKNGASSVLDIQASRTPFRQAVVNQKKSHLTNFEQIMDTCWTVPYVGAQIIRKSVHLPY